MTKYIICIKGDRPIHYNIKEIVASNIEDAVEEYAKADYDDEPWGEMYMELDVYLPDNLETPIGSFSVELSYDPNFTIDEI